MTKFESIKPARLLFQTAPGGPEIRINAPAAAGTAPQTLQESQAASSARAEAAKIEAGKEKQAVVEDAKKDLHVKIRETEQRLQQEGQTLDPLVRSELETYFRSSVDRADKNNDGRVTPDEVGAYKKEVLDQTDSILEKYLPKKQELDAKKKAVEVAAEQAETAVSSKKLPALEAIPEAGNLPIEQIEQAMQTYGGLNENFQLKIKFALEDIDRFGQTMKGYEEARSGLGAISYLGRKITGKDSKDQEKLTAELKRTQDLLKGKKQQLEDWKNSLKKYGEQLGDAGNREKARFIAERDQKTKEIADRTGKQDDLMKAKEAKYNELEKQQQKLKTRRDDLAASRTLIASRRQELDQQVKPAFEQKAEAATKNEDAAAAEIEALELLLKQEGLSAEAQVAVNAKLNTARERKGKAGTAKSLLQNGIQNGVEKVLKDLDTKKDGLAEDFRKTDSFLQNQIDPGLISTMQTLQMMEDLKLQYATTTDQLKSVYDSKIKGVDDMDRAVDEVVLQSSLANVQSMATLESASAQLNGVQISSEGFFATGWRAYSGFWTGVLGDTFGKGLTGIGKWLIDKGNAGVDLAAKSDSIFGKYVGGAAANIGAFAGGVVGGAFELGGGLCTMVAHPLDTAKGLGALIGRDPKTGNWSFGTSGEAWLNMGKGMIAYEDIFEKGNYASGLGKAGLNIATLFIGAGELDAAGKAGNAGRIAGEAAALRLAESTAAMGGKLTLGARIAGSPALARVTAYARTFATEIGSGIKGIPEALGSGWSNSLSVMREAAAAIKARPLMAPIEAGGKALVGGLRLTKDVALIPVTLPISILRTIKNLPKYFMGESKLGSAAKTLEMEGDNLAGLQDAVENLYAKDAALSDLSKANPAKAFNQALGKINQSQPELVRAYYRSKDAVTLLQQNGKTMADEASKALQKAKMDPEIAKAMARHDQLKQAVDKAKGPRVKARAQSALDTFLADEGNKTKLGRIQELEQAEIQLKALNERSKVPTTHYLQEEADQALLTSANEAYLRQTGEIKVQAELDQVLAGRTTKRAVQKALSKEYGETRFAKAVDSTELREITLEGKDYVVKMSDTGKVELLEAPVAPASTSATAAPSAAPTTKPAAVPAASGSSNASPGAPSAPKAIPPEAPEIASLKKATENVGRLEMLEEKAKNELAALLDDEFNPLPGYKKVADRLHEIQELKVQAVFDVELAKSILNKADLSVRAKAAWDAAIATLETNSPGIKAFKEWLAKEKAIAPELKAKILEQLDVYKEAAKSTPKIVAGKGREALNSLKGLYERVKTKLLPKQTVEQASKLHLFMVAEMGMAIGTDILGVKTKAEIGTAIEKMTIEERFLAIEKGIKALETVTAWPVAEAPIVIPAAPQIRITPPK